MDSESGSEVCSCLKGFFLQTDGVTCADRDECALEEDACAQNCHDRIGGYDCSCNSGYYLASDGYDCTGQLTHETTAFTRYSA